MPYNKYQNRKVNERKILHKIKKHWVVLSSALLMSLGGSALMSQDNFVHADQNDNVPKQVNNIDNNTVAENMNTRLTNANLSNRQNNDQNVNSQSSASNPRNDNNQSTQTIMSRAKQIHQQVFQNGMNSMDNHQTNEVQSNVLPNHYRLGASQSNNSDSDIGTITTRYIDDTTNKQIGSSSSDENYAEEPFTKQDKLSREEIAPNGYVFDKVLHDVDQYVGGQVNYFDIGVKPRSLVANHNQITIYFDNVDDKNAPVRKFVQSNQVGAPFNVNQFEANVPDGYVLNHEQPLISGQQVTNYQPGNQIVRIGILPAGAEPVDKPQSGTNANSKAAVSSAKANNSSAPANPSIVPNNNGSSAANHKVHQQNGQINVQYVNPQGQVITNVLLNRHVGYPFNVNEFEHVAPNGYDHFVKILSGQDVNKFANGNQLVRLEMDKPVSTNLKYGNIFIKFVKAAKSVNTTSTIPVGTPEVFTGRVNSPFDLSAEEKFAPQGYYFNKVLSGNNVKQYAQASQFVTFLVSNEPNQMGTINIIYMNGTHLVNSASLTKPFGTPFNLKDYVPSGYQYVGHDSTLPTTFDGTQSTIMYVKPLASNNMMNLFYINNVNGTTLEHKAIFGNPGSPLKLDQYIKSVPQGYHMVKISTNDHINTFTPNGDVVINVSPNVQTTPSAGTSQPLPSSASAANTSSGSSLVASQATSSEGSPLNSSSAPVNSATTSSNSSLSTNGSQQSVESTPIDHDNVSPVSKHPHTNDEDSNEASDEANQDSDSAPVNDPANGDDDQSGESEPSQTINQASRNAIKLGNANGYRTPSESNQNNSKLPQTGDVSRNPEAIASILISIGSSISALGYALKRRERKHGKND